MPRVEAERGLVEHEELRIAHERAADGEHLLFAAGERAGALLEPFLQARENAEDVLTVLRVERRVVLQVRAHREIFVHGQVGENHAALGHMAESAGDDPVRGQGGDVLAEKLDPAAFRAKQSGDGLKRGGLARAVAADERDDLALIDLDRDALDRLDLSVVDVDVLDLEKHYDASSAVPR